MSYKKILSFLAFMFLFNFFNVDVSAESQYEKHQRQQALLESRRIEQGQKFTEIRSSKVVVGMTTYKEIEDAKTAKIEEELENARVLREKESNDLFSKMVNYAKERNKRKREEREKIKAEKEKQAETDRLEREYKEKQEELERLDREFEELESEDDSDIQDTSLNVNKRQYTPPKDSNSKALIDGDAVILSSSDREMLEQIVMSESGVEPYDGQIAVTNVILNRLKSPRYPNTLKGVIFQKSQFSPVKNGVIRGYKPNDSVKKAVAEALAGKKIVPDETLYFVNPVLATDQTVPRTKTPVKVIGGHTFYK